MKKALIAMILLAGTACAAKAQSSNTTPERANIAVKFEESSASQVNLAASDNTGNFALTNPMADAAEAPAAAPAPAKPKYGVFGDRDDYRWQLGVGVEYLRFQSRAFDANLIGLNTTLTYYTNSWFALEGNVITGFGPDVFPNSMPRIFGGAGGIKIGGRRSRWEPWGHILVGGAHLEPQTAYGDKNSLLTQAGLGVDYRLHERLSLRGEADWVYTRYYNDSQNNIQAVAGVVFHF